MRPARITNRMHTLSVARRQHWCDAKVWSRIQVHTMNCPPHEPPQRNVCAMWNGCGAKVWPASVGRINTKVWTMCPNAIRRTVVATLNYRNRILPLPSRHSIKNTIVMIENIIIWRHCCMARRRRFVRGNCWLPNETCISNANDVAMYNWMDTSTTIIGCVKHKRMDENVRTVQPAKVQIWRNIDRCRRNRSDFDTMRMMMGRRGY